MAVTHLGTFDDLVKSKSNDEQVSKQIQQARQLLSKKASSACPATLVREEDEVEVKVSTPMIGPSKAHIEKWTGARHSAADIGRCAPQRLQRRDHARPDSPIHLPSKTIVKKSQVKLPAEQQIFHEQTDDSFKFCKARRLDDDKSTKLLLLKTQTCAFTLESLFERSDAVRKQKGLHLKPRMAGMASLLGNPWAAAACPDDRASSNPTGWRKDADLERAMRSAAWRTMELMAATLRRSFFRSLGRC